jgi:hypothetical protein
VRLAEAAPMGRSCFFRQMKPGLLDGGAGRHAILHNMVSASAHGVTIDI